MVERWQYAVRTVHHTGIDCEWHRNNMLNEMGKNGYELVGITTRGDTDTLYFKRPLIRGEGFHP